MNSNKIETGEMLLVIDDCTMVNLHHASFVAKSAVNNIKAPFSKVKTSLGGFSLNRS